jgi:shikimate dehydrogenase
VGKDISHSKSPEIYKHLISPSIQYDLLDFKSAEDVPSASDLFKSYEGINITSPYKKHFLSEVQLTQNASSLEAINCLRIKNGIIEGENTDFYAIVDIIQELKKDYGVLEVVVLGDGVMSKVTAVALKKLAIDYKVLSRRLTDDFNQINMKNYFSANKMTPLIINTCSREYVFKGEIPKEAVFWDYNYSFSPHSTSLPSKIRDYFDGHSMLLKQAEYALAFWSGN